MDEIIRRIGKPGVSSTLTFMSDHGEHIGPTGGGHGGDCSPKKVEYPVPLIVWYSQEYLERYPNKVENLIHHKDKPVCSDNIFYSVCDIADIQLSKEYWHPEYSIYSSEWTEHKRLVLLPDGINTFECE